MHIKIGFFLLLAAGVAVPLLSSTARSSSATIQTQGRASAERKTLLEELSKACLDASKERDTKKVKSECECLVRYHAEVSQDRYLKVVIDAYSGHGEFNTPKISDETSIVLNNDADALEKCEKNPAWRGDR
jgi:hypothetical protein